MEGHPGPILHPAFREELLEHYVSGGVDDASEGGETLSDYYAYLASRGRNGRRSAMRFWERSITLDDSKEILVVA